MEARSSGYQRWLKTALLAGVLYLVVGVTSGTLAGRAASDPMRTFWRWSAFVLSAVVLAAHVADEHFRLRHSARPSAWHASVAAAVGGFGLAMAANMHELGSASGYRPRMLLALAVWPLLTAVPAFVVALVLAAGLGRMREASR